MQTLLTVRSMTYAQKGQRLLRRSWSSAGVVRTPERYAARGCSYGLLVQGDGKREENLLRENGVEVLGRYPYGKE